MTDTALRLSIALCTYNGERFLLEQLQTFATQTRRPDEVIICDDRSTDGTVDIARDFAAHAPFPVRVLVNERNLGSTKNFERAIAQCTGDLIALSDQDDVWHCQKLAHSEQALLAAPGADIVFSDAYVVDDALRPLGPTLWDTLLFGPDLRSRFHGGDAFGVLFNKTVVTGATMVFRSRVRDFVLPIPATIVHDNWISLLVSAVSDIVLLDEPLMYYRQHAANQIGAQRMSLAWHWRRHRYLRTGGRAATGHWCDEAARRLESVSGRLRHPQAVELLRDMAAHGQIRSQLPANRLLRLAPVLHELRTGRYKRYSTGLVSVVMDMLV